MTAAIDDSGIPGHMPERLVQYWVHGKGALKIRWGQPGDFKRCVRNLVKYFPRDPKGLCNRLHVKALGVPPGKEHALAFELGEFLDDFADISTSERKGLAKKGEAMPDGSFPIRNTDDLKNAIQSIGRAKESARAAVKRHIMKRARELDAEDLIPEDWRKAKAGLTADGAPAVVIELDDEDDADDTVYADEAELVPMKDMWRGTLAPLGVPTGDRRRFQPGGISYRDLPLPLLWQKQTGEGHQASVVVGRILAIEPRDDQMYGMGDWLPTDDAYQARELLKAGVVGPSVDLDDLSYELRVPGTDTEWKPADQCNDQGECSVHEFVVTKGRIAGATLVAIPAFAEAKLELYQGPDEERVLAELDEMPDVPDAKPCGCGMSAAAIGDYCEPVRGLTAAATTSFTPPGAAFTVAEPDHLMGLRMDETSFPGYVAIYGHLAGWEIPHLTHRLKTPKSKSRYAYFHLGHVYTAEGDELLVGKLTYGGTHASEELGLIEAMRHYDDTSRAVAVGRAEDGKHGIWYCGVLLPGVDESTRLALEIHQPSGDWRYVGRDLEMVAALIVNVPAFPVTRVHESNGRITALVACAGPNTIDRMVTERVEARMAAIAHEERVAAAARLRVEFVAAEQRALAGALGLEG